MTHSTPSTDSSAPVDLARSRHRTMAAPARRRWIHDDLPTPYTQGALALTYPATDAAADAELALVSGEPIDAIPDALPDAHDWAVRFIQAVIEVVSSDRPLTQLARWTDRRVFDDLARRRDQVARHRKPGQVRAARQQVATVHVWRPSVGSAEVAARVTMGGRSRAIAARLDVHRGRWLCTALTFG